MNISPRWALAIVAACVVVAGYVVWSSQKEPELPAVAPGTNARQQDNPEDRPPAHGH